MASVFPVLNEHIRRLARREVRAEILGTRRMASQYRQEIASLKRMIQSLSARVQLLERRGPAVVAAVPDDLPENVRFRADGLRSHRARLGISAQEYGRLIGVSALAVYNWESGKSKPRKRQLAALLALRSLGKREALRRLAGLNDSPDRN